MGELMADMKEQIAEILHQFQEYLTSDDAKEHLKVFAKEKQEVKELMQKLSRMDKTSSEFTEWVLYGLLPQYKTKAAKRVSIFPSFMNIKGFFKEYGYTDKEWNVIANNIFALCSGFEQHPERLPELINAFAADKYSRRLQIGSITPILFCINDNYPIVNNIVRRTYKELSIMFGKKEKLSQKLAEYPTSIKRLEQFTDKLGLELLKDHNNMDLFCYWFDTIYQKEVEAGQEESEDTNGDEETDSVIESINLPEFIDSVNLKDKLQFEQHFMRSPERIKVRDLLANAHKGTWLLPHFQRYFDWKKSDIKGFLYAIFCDYYVGAILVWDTDKEPSVGVQPIKGVILAETPRPDAIILDGQQRITSLYYAIKAPNNKGFEEKTNWGDTKIHREHPLYFYINFNKFLIGQDSDEIIETLKIKLTNEETYKKLLFPLYELENYNDWIYGLDDYLHTQSKNSEHIRQIQRVLDKLLKHFWEGFEIPYIALPKTMKIDQVTDIFEGINSTGKKLTVFDLLIARLYKYDQHLKYLWDSSQKEYIKLKQYSDPIDKLPTYILQAISLLYEQNSSAKKQDILDIYSNIYENSERDFEDDWNDVAEYMNRAILKLENMKDGFGVNDARELPFAPTIPILTALLKHIDGQDNKIKCNKKLQQWYWSTVFTNYYSSAVDSKLTADFKEMKKWFEDDNELPKVVIQMQRELSNLYLKEVQSKSNTKYKGVMSLFALEGAKDFETGLTLENARTNDKDHIFPKTQKYNFGQRKNVNSVLNMTWLSALTNRRKSAKKPSAYIKEFIKEKYDDDETAFLKILSTHLIDKECYDALLNDDFEQFLTLREELVVKKIQQLIGMDKFIVERTLIDSNTPFTNKMVYSNLIKSCQGYIYWMDKYFSIAGLETIHQSVDGRKVKNIHILMAIEKADESFRDAFKDFKTELHNKGIECECRIITDSKSKGAIHDRFLINKYDAYNIPSPDIIERGQLSEVNKSNNREELLDRFEELWEKSKDIIHDWNKILAEKK